VWEWVIRPPAAIVRIVQIYHYIEGLKVSAWPLLVSFIGIAGVISWMLVA
jgi:hypothetical protein